VTAELTHLVVETAQLPADAQMCRARTSIDCQYMLIGADEFLIPRQSQLETLSGNANETSSITTFSGCHEYTVESSLQFDAPRAAAPVNPTAQLPLPSRPASP